MAPCRSAWADRVILRNLDIISDTAITSVDDDGLKLAGGRFIGWDEVERATTISPRPSGEGPGARVAQEQIDERLKTLGEPLYRIRARLKVGDSTGLLKFAEPLADRFSASQGRSAALVHTALYRGLVEAGRYEEAVAPLLAASDGVARGFAKGFDGAIERALELDPATGLAADLPPLFFDKEAAQKSLPIAFEVIRQMKAPLPASARLYYAGLLIVAGQPEKAPGALNGLPWNDALTPWREVLLAGGEIATKESERAIGRLLPRVAGFPPPARALAYYYLGTAQDDPPRDVLWLLHIPAAHATTYPHVTAMAIYQASEKLAERGDAAAAQSLRQELRTQYPATHAAKRLSHDSEPEA